jgi:mercuric ion transport protein
MKPSTNTSATEPSTNNWQQSASSVLALFTSAGTLICCALPVLVVTIAGGSALVSLISTFPWLVTISQYSGWIFLGAGILIAFSGLLILRPKGKVACSITGGKGCEVAGRIQKIMFWIAVVIYGVGLFAAYGLVHIVKLFA